MSRHALIAGTLFGLVGIQALVVPQNYFGRPVSSRSNLEKRRRSASDSAPCRDQVTSLNYEVMEALSPAFEIQLAACASLVLSGSYFDSQTLIAPATPVMVEFNDDENHHITEDNPVDIYRYVLLFPPRLLFHFSTHR